MSNIKEKDIQHIINCPFCKETLPTKVTLKAETIEEKIIAIVKQYTPEIYRNEHKLLSLINYFYEKEEIGRLLKKIIIEGGADEVYKLQYCNRYNLEDAYYKALEVISNNTFIAPSTLTPAVDLLCLGLGIELIEFKEIEEHISTIDELEQPLITPIEEFEIKDGVLTKYIGKSKIIFIPSEVTSIGKRAFNWCENITTINIPKSVDVIGRKAFLGCRNLIGINIPDSIITIEESAFSFCESLTSINLPNSIETIESFAFNSCVSLTNVRIPEKLTCLEVGIFSNCRSLTKVVIPDTVTRINEFAFSLCTRLPSIELPNSITHIGANAFAECINITSINIPKELRVIEEYVFYLCKNLSKIEIPNKVEEIKDFAFALCVCLTTLTLPNEIEKIHETAFSECNNLKILTIPSITNDFSQCERLPADIQKQIKKINHIEE